jgi:hypothetical protein
MFLDIQKHLGNKIPKVSNSAREAIHKIQCSREANSHIYPVEFQLSQI